jgi:hypothetical protein
MAGKLKALEQENRKVKHLVVEVTLDKRALPFSVQPLRDRGLGESSGPCIR